MYSCLDCGYTADYTDMFAHPVMGGHYALCWACFHRFKTLEKHKFAVEIIEDKEE